MNKLQGKGIGRGIAVGRILFYKKSGRQIRRTYREDSDAELKRLADAVEVADAQLKALAEGVPGDHIHYDMCNSLEEGSDELVFERVE